MKIKNDLEFYVRYWSWRLAMVAGHRYSDAANLECI